MKTTIDAAGRVVIPKALREKLGLVGRRSVEIRERGERLEIDVVSVPVTLTRRRGVRVAVPGRKLPPLTDVIVSDTIERVRRYQLRDRAP